MMKLRHSNTGFTLIEMSIVLVIIGLIIGGILLGRDLIGASEANAQIAQIAKYSSAVNTFQNKYGGIPGDLSIPLANQFGFHVGSACSGQVGGRDGNGLIDGYTSPNIYLQTSGENNLFWQDLSSANLIDGTFPNSGAGPEGCSTSVALNLTPGTTYVGDYFPTARIGHSNFVYVFEIGGANWYGVSALLTAGSVFTSGATIPVVEAYNIDKKVDDGLPTTGTVKATYLNSSNTVVQNVNAQSTDSNTSCYNTTNNVYSISASANQGNGLNCALSFRFQ